MVPSRQEGRWHTVPPMTQFWDETARDLLARTASGDPTPGGGAAGAVAAAFGVALMEMALHIALERSWREDVHPERRALLPWLAGQREPRPRRLHGISRRAERGGSHAAEEKGDGFHRHSGYLSWSTMSERICRVVG